MPHFASYVLLHLLMLLTLVSPTAGIDGFVETMGGLIENLPIFLLVCGSLTLTLNFLGTSLPASVAERGQGLTAAIRRGWQTDRWLALVY